jgi:serine protease Do
MQPPGPVRGTGSGVVIDPAGHVITNAHVVEHSGRVTISFAEGDPVPAHVLGADPMTDVAVVQIDKPPKDLVAARLGDASKVRIGEWMLAVGSPLGMHQTVTTGIISGLGKTGAGFRFESGQRVRGYLQTDAKINPGNSGGPLVNLAAEVVGINTLINVGPGGSYGFAIPIDQVKEVAATIIKDGQVRYPYLGVMIGSLTDAPPELRARIGKDTTGALVSDVTPDGPAAAAGIKPGDVITKLGDQAVKQADDVVAYVSAQKIGRKLPVEIVREGKTRSLDVTLAAMPIPGQADAGQARVGVRLQTLTPEVAQALGRSGNTRGAVVTEVAPGSLAEHAGLHAGDVILEIDRKAVATADEAAQILRNRKGRVLLRVLDESGTPRFVGLDLGTS